MEETGEAMYIPCFALASEKPLWSGELSGFRSSILIHPDGYHVGSNVDPTLKSTVKSSELTTTADGQLNPLMLMVSLDQAVRIGPQQTAVADVRVLASQNKVQSSTGPVVPMEDILAPKKL